MKKVLFLGFLTLLLINCGGNESDVVKPDPTPDPIDEEIVIIAKDDVFEANEGTFLELPSFLTNDEYPSTGITITFDDATANGGTIEVDRITYIYTPSNNFSGEDTFNYTICSKVSPEICSTATVTINVADKGSPEAVNDSYNVGINSTINISSHLDNDTIIDGAKVDSLDDTSTNGTVTLNSDGTITYTPVADFTGQDNFTYTLCDNDATATCATATITINVVEVISFNIPAELAAYYNGVSFIDDQNTNYNTLIDLVTKSHSNILTYGERHNYLYNADEDLSNVDNVILMYTSESRDEREYTSGSNTYPTQTFNTEHVYPQSKLSAEDAVTDLHHLRSCDDAINTQRSNFPFIDGTGTYKKEGSTWFPGDEWKGDIARMVFYLNVRYGETFEKVGSKELFLKWNKEDPVSDFERQRNNVIYDVQGNRNPFIDNPYLVTITWGGDAAINTWE
ncbi:endonuclease [Tenacibaculum sp. AHE15PA]|uniref:endonuclease n=1 Tax=unclassified Tenacibaculum TaxID=2635139 RepID=UPI001C50052A|nr:MULTISPECIES: endonuclease [unclassified Tenacibaculum]QXP73188.1 endonuclease [Tenacibaculum sp. AHE14PA]QXP77101.1 endonuclease [Tenacibaculum sp. AHE15PA]